MVSSISSQIKEQCFNVDVDLSMKSLTGGEPELLLRAMGRAMLRAGLLSGEYYEAATTEGELIGFLVTMPPGQDMFSTSVSS